MSSILSARITPPIPPASQTYEPLARNVLRRRLQYDILMPSFVFSWAVTTLWAGWILGGAGNMGLTRSLTHPFSLGVLFFSSLFWLSNIVPIIVLRKVYLTAETNPAPSPLQAIKTAFSKPTTFRVLSVYTACAIIAAALHIVMTYTYGAGAGSDPRLHVFVKSRKHPYYLNGRFLFVILAQLMFAAAYHFRNIMLDRFAVHWKHAKLSSTKTRAISRHLGRAVKVAFVASIFTLLVFSVYIVAFGLARSVVLPLLFKIPLLSMLLRPFCAHFLRGPWTITLLVRHLSLVSRTFMLAFTTVASWEFAESLFDEKIQEPPDIGSCNDAGFGHHLQNAYYKYFAYWELDDYAKDDSATAVSRRTAMFSDQKFNPSIWATLVRESLLFLGNDYQIFLRRGKPAPPAPAAPPPKPKGPDVPSTPILRKPIFKSSSAHSPISQVLESFAADGAVTQALESSVETTAAHIPEIFRAIEAPAAAKAKSVVEKSEAVVKRIAPPAKGRELLSRTVQKYVPQSAARLAGTVAEWWQRKRVSKLAEIALPHRDVDTLIVEALSYLVCASLTEDRYGVVQRDIPRILEAMLSFLSAIEEYQAELAQSVPVGDGADSAAHQSIREEISAANDVLATVAGVLKEGIVRIVSTFGDKLSAFKFPPHIARKLQGFVDYH